jgi:hypothetical protein
MTEAGFRAEVAASFPAAIPLPPPIEHMLDWMEQEGFVARYRRRDGRFAGVFPVDSPGWQSSQIAFHAVDPGQTDRWIQRTGQPIADRFAIFVRTGGDGSMAGIWRDETGRDRFVHMGSGSGSTLACVLADDPIDFLRFLAIGYAEPCWEAHFHLTPAEVDGDGYLPPARFQHWVSETFDVAIPRTASEIVPVVACLDDAESSDPFWRWLKTLE